MTALSLAELTLGEGGAECPVCGRTDCRPDFEHLNRADYPFMPGGKDPMADKPWITAPHRIVDHELGRVVYGTGDRVPIADAIKYGLVDTGSPQAVADTPVENAPQPERAKRGRRTRHKPGPDEDR